MKGDEKEMHHADKLIDRIIFLEGHPNLQKLDPLRIGQNAKETLECDLAAEHEARDLYKEARDHCEKVGDYVSKNLFEELMTDEEGHIDFLETQLDLLENVGAEKFSQLNALPMDEAE
jgi:bacterioferritin